MLEDNLIEPDEDHCNLSHQPAGSWHGWIEVSENLAGRQETLLGVGYLCSSCTLPRAKAPRRTIFLSSICFSIRCIFDGCVYLLRLTLQAESHQAWELLSLVEICFNQLKSNHETAPNH